MERKHGPTSGRTPADPSLDTKRGLRVLVVDDDTDSADSMALLLRMYGHEVRTAADGVQALRAAQEQQPDVVLLDIVLPGMNGFEVARRLQQQQTGKRSLFVAVTGFREEADRHFSPDANFDLHLLKPVNPEELQKVLERFQQLMETAP
jgi:CheY-like chemotaxis protein